MKAISLLFLAGLVVSCAQFAPPVQKPPVQKPTNIMELQFEDVGSNQPRARVVMPERNSAAGVSKQGLNDVGSKVSFQVKNVETLTDKATMTRYMQATFEITNTSATTIERLFITPVDLDDDADPNNHAISPTIGDTPFAKVRLFDGTDVPAKAEDLVPGPAVIYDFQALDYIEDVQASPFYALFDSSTLTPAVPSGLAAVNVKDYTWYLERPLAAGSSATVTLAVSFPVDSIPANNPFSFSMMVAFGQNAEEFTLLGDSLNFDPDFDGVAPDITLDTLNQPVVAWEEETYYGPIHVMVKQWNGSTWAMLGDPLNMNPTTDAGQASIAQDGSDQFIVAWEENGDIFVKQWDGSVWNNLGTALDLDQAQQATAPDVTVNGSGNPVVTWAETDATSGIWQVVAKAWDGTQWTLLDGSLNIDPVRHALESVITHSSTGQPIVAWVENDSSGNQQVYVKQWNGTTWDLLGGGAVNPTGTQSGYLDLISDASDRLTVGWSDDGTIRVSRWDGASWTEMGNGLNIDVANPAFLPALGLKPDGRPVAVWTEVMSVPQVVSKIWDGTSWVQYGDTLNNNFDDFAAWSSVVTDPAGTSYVAFAEMTRCGCISEVFVKSIP